MFIISAILGGKNRHNLDINKNDIIIIIIITTTLVAKQKVKQQSNLRKLAARDRHYEPYLRSCVPGCQRLGYTDKPSSWNSIDPPLATIVVSGELGSSIHGSDVCLVGGQQSCSGHACDRKHLVCTPSSIDLPFAAAGASHTLTAEVRRLCRHRDVEYHYRWHVLLRPPDVRRKAFCPFPHPDSNLPDRRAGLLQKYIRGLILGRTRKIHSYISPTLS